MIESHYLLRNQIVSTNKQSDNTAKNRIETDGTLAGPWYLDPVYTVPVQFWNRNNSATDQPTVYFDLVNPQWFSSSMGLKFLKGWV